MLAFFIVTMSSVSASLASLPLPMKSALCTVSAAERISSGAVLPITFHALNHLSGSPDFSASIRCPRSMEATSVEVGDARETIDLILLIPALISSNCRAEITLPDHAASLTKPAAAE